MIGLLVAVALSTVGVSGPAAKPFVPALRADSAVVWAVGDGADGGEAGRAVADLIGSRRVDRFLYLGDVYATGTIAEFLFHYRPLFGRFDRRAAPTPGNHEYANRRFGYLPYWSAVRGGAVPSWYSTRAAGWQLLSLNSLASSGPGSEQLDWLRRRLGGTPRFGDCRIAFTHHPRFSAGFHGETPALEPIWRALSGRARVLVSAHDHDMQRLRVRDGIVQLVSGAGGHELRATDERDPRLAFASDGRPGALRLKLSRSSALASFVAADGTLLDQKRIRCHRRAAR